MIAVRAATWDALTDEQCLGIRSYTHGVQLGIPVRFMDADGAEWVAWDDSALTDEHAATVAWFVTHPEELPDGQTTPQP